MYLFIETSSIHNSRLGLIFVFRYYSNEQNESSHSIYLVNSFLNEAIIRFLSSLKIYEISFEIFSVLSREKLDHKFLAKSISCRILKIYCITFMAFSRYISDSCILKLRATFSIRIN